MVNKIVIDSHQPYDQHCDQQYDHHNANTTHQPDDQHCDQHVDQRWSTCGLVHGDEHTWS